MPNPLPESEVTRRMAEMTGWVREGPGIRRTFERESFPAAIAFVNRVAELAEAADHHPDMLIQYRKVTVTTWSHDAGGLTDRDFRLARQIDASA
jgi:4a-hydroxytetrahydrobiopterin dehydratase